MQPWAAIACRPSDVERNDRLLKLHQPIVSEILRSSKGSAFLSASSSSDSVLSRDSLASRFQALSSRTGSGSPSLLPPGSQAVKRELSCEGLEHRDSVRRAEEAKENPQPLLDPGEQGADALFAFNAPVKYEYVEVKPTAFLSIAASLTPYSNHNQSPR